MRYVVYIGLLSWPQKRLEVSATYPEDMKVYAAALSRNPLISNRRNENSVKTKGIRNTVILMPAIKYLGLMIVTKMNNS